MQMVRYNPSERLDAWEAMSYSFFNEVTPPPFLECHSLKIPPRHLLSWLSSSLIYLPGTLSSMSAAVRLSTASFG